MANIKFIKTASQ